MEKLKNIIITVLIGVFVIFGSDLENIEIPSFEDFFGTKEKINIENKDIEELYNSIDVIEELPKIDYNRKDWEAPRRTFESKCKTKRISIRDYSVEKSIYAVYENGNLKTYVDPYSGEVTDDIKSMDYDHIIPLSYTARGTTNWTNEEKNEYAFNLFNGVPVSARDNRVKGAKGPSEWLPKVNQESYVYTWLMIASEYNISLTKEDMKTIKKILNNVDNVEVINLYN